MEGYGPGNGSSQTAGPNAHIFILIRHSKFCAQAAHSLIGLGVGAG